MKANLIPRIRWYGPGCAGVLLIALVLACSTSADGFEPNNSLAAAAGPLLTGQYEGAIDSAGDADFFDFYVTSPQGAKVRVELKNLGGGQLSDVDLTVLDSTATPRASISFLRPGESSVIELSLPAQKYFLEVTSREQPGDSYLITTSGTAGAFGSYDVIAGRCGANSRSASSLGKKLSEATVKLQRTLNKVRRSRYLGPTARTAARDRYRQARSAVARTRKERDEAERLRGLWCSISP
jgi:hypothetical protein